MKKFAVCFAVLALLSCSVKTRAQAPANDLNLHGLEPNGTQVQSTPNIGAPSPTGESLPLHGTIPDSSSIQQTPNPDAGSNPSPFRTIGATNAANVPVLQGSAYQVKVSARNLDKSPLTRNHDANLKYVEVTVKNDGPNIAVILGNAVHASVGGEDLPVAPAAAAENSDRPHISGKGNLVVWAATLPTLAVAGPITYELMTPDQHAKRYLGTAIGRDGSRQEVEATHFGIRVIMPGDETTGWFAFPCPPSAQVQSLVVPISFTRSKIGAGSIVVPVAQSASK